MKRLFALLAVCVAARAQIVAPNTVILGPLSAGGGGGGGSGTVTSVSVSTANGVSGTVATATTTPAISLTLGAITPTSVNGNTFTTGTYTLTGTAAKTLDFTNTLTLAGTDSTTMTFPSTSGKMCIRDRRERDLDGGQDGAFHDHGASAGDPRRLPGAAGKRLARFG